MYKIWNLKTKSEKKEKKPKSGYYQFLPFASVCNTAQHRSECRMTPRLQKGEGIGLG